MNDFQLVLKCPDVQTVASIYPCHPLLGSLNNHFKTKKIYTVKPFLTGTSQ